MVSAYSILCLTPGGCGVFSVNALDSFPIRVARIAGSVIAASIVASIHFDYYPISDDVRGSLACSFDTASGCSYCGNRIDERECPEWTTDEVTRLVQSEYKLITVLAVIFIMYAISATRYGMLARKHISLYQVDYV